MKRKSIPFRELLEDILPTDTLPRLEQTRIAKALASDDLARIEGVALATLDKLVTLGYLRLIEEVQDGDERVIRYQDLRSTDTIALRLPAEPKDEEIHKVALPLRDWHGATSLDQVRSLFNLYNKTLTHDAQLLRGEGDILRQIMHATREMTGCQRVSFWS